MNVPQLLAVPHFLRPLTVKADLNGITVLRDGRFKKRYTGSKQFEVDINGNLRTRKDLKKLLEAEKKKGPPVSRRATRQNKCVSEVREKKYYSLNKPEIRARIFAMIASQPAAAKQLYFWTVTFPLQTEDEVIYKLFNTWLTKLRTLGHLKNYLWVAERQKNGTLHFHLAIPHKMPVKVANREMMICICTAIKAGTIAYSLHAAKRYNGVDIHKPRKNGRATGPATNFALGKRGRRSLTGYITKYVTKNDGSFLHLAWHNSRGFSMLFTAVTFTFDESRNVYNWRFFAHSRPAVTNEYFFYYPWINGPPPNLEGELIKLNSFIQNLN